MRILIVSDTHGDNSNLIKVLNKIEPPDCMIHLGDSECTEEEIKSLTECPVYMVCGNCDYFTKFPPVRIEEMDSCRLFITHGHYYNVNAGTRKLFEAAKINGCNFAMFGHTHRPFIDESNPELTIMNPGSLSFPRQEGRRPSYIMMETFKDKRPSLTLNYLDKKNNLFR